MAMTRKQKRLAVISGLGLVLALALIGTGSKAGLVPLHVWLPLAHPAAPSHVSALMSGVMTKVAVYGFVRIVFDLLGEPSWWWSIAVLGLGSITAVLGVLYALMQRDLKRLLAYSTVENIGIIFIGLGLALAFKASGYAAPAALALTAALFHVLNHSFFKSLLFFGAGAVLNSTGERNIERLGGLIQRMPIVAFCSGRCLAISALPPLNGFVSSGCFPGDPPEPGPPQWGLKLTIPAAGAMLALAAALSARASCALRHHVPGRPRSPEAQAATETDPLSRAGMYLLLGACLIAGILPGLIIDGIAPVVQAHVGLTMPTQTTNAWLSIIPIAESRSSYNGLLFFVFIIISTMLAVEVIHRYASHDLRRAPPWDCGSRSRARQRNTPQTALRSRPPRLRRVRLPARERVDMPPPGDPRRPFSMSA